MRRLMLMALEAYKRYLSPQLPVACRFTPTCSEYAAEAVTRHGALGGRGLDPVPEHFGCRCAERAGAARTH